VNESFTPPTYPLGTVCEHGHLARQCKLCEQAAELAHFATELARVAQVAAAAIGTDPSLAVPACVDVLANRAARLEAELAAARAELAEAVALLRDARPQLSPTNPADWKRRTHAFLARQRGEGKP